jgi:hypothetical protein
MHAVVVNVTINDIEKGREFLSNEVVPRVSQAPGFVAGYWTRKDNSGLSMIVCESADAAQALANQIHGPPDESVTLDGVEVREVVEHA